MKLTDLDLATLWSSADGLRASLMRLARAKAVKKWVARLEPSTLSRLLFREWPVFAGAAQRPPLSKWRTWLMLGGRGAGKTRAGAEWIRALAAGDAHFPGDAAGRIALVGESYADARAVMVEGESGLLAVHHRRERPQWNPSKRQLAWSNGVIGQVFSASDPESLRGSQFGASWSDEICKWPYAEETWDMLQFCLRLGSDPRQMATTTPKPLPLIRRMLADPATAVTRSSTHDNRANLAPGFLEFLIERYGGTRLGRQELDGEIIEDREDALWRRDQIEACRRPPPEALMRTVVAVDPPAGAGRTGAACGIVAVGMDAARDCYVLADRSIRPALPNQWAEAACSLYHALGADAVVAEVNQGGAMVHSCLAQSDASVPVVDVRATRGKWLRAEPVAILYERGRVFHAGRFPELEDQMCALGPDGRAEGLSPDRLDALVWAIHHLALRPHLEPRIRAA